jgi:hypothetical protein
VKPHWPRLRPLDLMTIGYLAVVSALILIFHNRVHDWYAFPLAFAAAALLVIGIVAAHERWPESRSIALARYAYPLAFSPVLYTVIDRYVLVLRGHFLDAGMNTWEQLAFGGHPNVAIGHLVSPPLTEAVYICYFGFYLFFIVPPALLFRARRDADLERYVFALMAALYVCYLGFLLVPLAGPEASLAGQLRPTELTGYVVVPLQRFIMAHGDPAGACFPSAHVAGAWTALFAIRALMGRRAFRWVLPFTVGLTIAVVYTRYHYLSDAFAGAAVAAVVFPLVARHGWRLVSGMSRAASQSDPSTIDHGPLAA